MNTVLRGILDNKASRLPDGTLMPIDSAVPENHGLFLQRLIEKTRPKTVLEIGLALGVSTLFMLDALKKVKGSKIIGIDPNQFDPEKGEKRTSWKGGGIFNIHRAGYKSMYEFHNEPSHYALPMLAHKKTLVDFAFIDGYHTFDHTLIDFFFIDLMLKKNGIVAFHNVEYPSIRKVCEFILKNRDYDVYDAFPKVFNKFNPLHSAFVAALIKNGSDRRHFHDFIEF